MTGSAPIILDLLEFPRDCGDAEAWVAIARDPLWQSGDAPPRIACRQVLDKLLARLPNPMSPETIIDHDHHGAPVLAGIGEKPPRISLAHSGPWIAVGLARTARIGVDIEQHSRQRNFPAMAEYLGWQDPVTDAIEFYSRWTLWEAYVKCVGKSVLERENDEFRALATAEQSGSESFKKRWQTLQGAAENKVQFAVVLRFTSRDSIRANRN